MRQWHKNMHIASSGKQIQRYIEDWRNKQGLKKREQKQGRNKETQ